MKKSAKLHSGKKSAKQGRLSSSHRGLAFFSVWPHKLSFLAKLLQSPKRAEKSFNCSLCTMIFCCCRMVRMVLMMVLFPLLSISLIAWMAIFGFYLRLEEVQWTRLACVGLFWNSFFSQTGRGSVDKVSFFWPFLKPFLGPLFSLSLLVCYQDD